MLSDISFYHKTMCPQTYMPVVLPSTGVYWPKIDSGERALNMVRIDFRLGYVNGHL